MSETNTPGLYTALLAAQQNMGKVVKNATNPAFRTKYADLGAVLDAITGPLNDAGLLLVQRFGVDAGGPVLVTEVIHAASGASLTSTVPVTCKDPTDPQKMGGAITYYRRYSLLALLGLAPEDDDGHSAAQPARPANAPVASPQPRRDAEAPTPAPAPTPPRKVADWPDEELLAVVLDDTRDPVRRVAAAKIYAVRAVDPLDLNARMIALAALPTADREKIRAGMLARFAPASIAG